MRKNLLSALAMFFLVTAASAQVILFDPIQRPGTAGLAAQDFETANDNIDCYVADDFTIPAGGSDWYIDSIIMYGFYSATAADTAGAIVSIYQNTGGALGNLVFTDTFQTDVDKNGDGWLTPSWVGNPIQLPPGDYWLVGAARKDFGGGGGQWFWFRDTALTGDPAMWQNPQNGFGTGCSSWVPLYNCAALNMSDSGFAFRMFGCFGPTKPAGTGIIGGDTTFCSGTGTAPLSATTTSSDIGYLWSNGETSQSIAVDEDGSYSVLIFDTITQCGLLEGPVDITILETPTFDIPDATICPDILPFTLFANPANANVTWFDGTTGLITTVPQAGTYWANYTGNNGCIGSDTMTLTVEALDPPTFVPGSTLDLCDGDEIAVSTVISYSAYEWGNANDPGTVLESDSIFVVDEGGSYFLIVTAANGCSSEGDFTVVDRPTPEPNLQETYTSTLNVNLRTSAAYASYSWSTGEDTRSITVTENGVYTVTVVDEFGCEGTETYNVNNVGIDDPITEAFNFFPNPTTGLVNFTWPAYNEEALVQVYDATGSLVKTITSTSGLQVIDLNTMDNGIYFVRMTTPDGEGHLKLIKQ